MGLKIILLHFFSLSRHEINSHVSGDPKEYNGDNSGDDERGVYIIIVRRRIWCFVSNTSQELTYTAKSKPNRVCVCALTYSIFAGQAQHRKKKPAKQQQQR